MYKTTAVTAHSITIPLYCLNTIIEMKNSGNYLQTAKPSIAIYLMFNAIDVLPSTKLFFGEFKMVDLNNHRYSCIFN